MKTQTFLLWIMLLAITSCADNARELQDYNFGDELDLTSFVDSLSTFKIVSSAVDTTLTGGDVPQTREDLSGLKTIVKTFDGQRNAGITIPGFGGLKLDKKQSNINLYYIETKIVETATDTTVYGIGYSVHYLFSKVKRGIQITNLSSVAASAQLQSNKTSVAYSLQSYGIAGRELSKFFKPEVNSNFDVDGFGVIQSKLDGIHNVITDSLLSKRTKYTPEKFFFVSPEDLRN